MDNFIGDIEGAIKDIGSTVDDALGGKVKEALGGRRWGETHSHTHAPPICSDGDSHHLHRFQSFAPQREGNDVKWFVDGCGYFWAVSEALELAQHEIWILDWWLSPELYLRRPPAKNEQYRLDRMLFAAANRGVKIFVIVYKEVTQALTLSSYHTKHWLEDNDKSGNIKVLRHPDHLPDKQTLVSSFVSSIKQSGLNASKLAQLPGDALKGLYGVEEDTILYWAHHEKLCVIDGHTAFMGGLDLCFGRWDTNQHSIADAHPGDLNNITFPGQDYNNARIMDFQNVQDWQANKLDRRYNSRMGWSDVSISLRGPVVDDLRAHFAQRWNFVYYEKYDVRRDERYLPINYRESRTGIIGHPYQAAGGAEVQGEGQYDYYRRRMREQYEAGRELLRERGVEGVREGIHEEWREWRGGGQPGRSNASLQGGMHCQIMRSCTKWSHGVPLEHSIANAYIDTIANSKHFVYIENQFFITATADEQSPVHNRIGSAIVERIIRAARNHEQWHMIVAIPAVPGFAGDLKADEALGTRAIMKFQYNSINRAGHSIMERVAQEGIDPMQYIRFYNLRNYDRINSSKAMQDVENRAGVAYNAAATGYDEKYGLAGETPSYSGVYGNPPSYGPSEDYQNAPAYGNPQSDQDAFDRYQKAAREVHTGAGKLWDTVASCYMFGGEDIRSVPWDGDAQSELNALVSEELYIHSKILIADDQKVICGSANLNDRSQLGSHDSEIAILVEDQNLVDSSMAGKPWRASRFAASLRRLIFRKHLGLLPAQDCERPDANFSPIGQDPNKYDWGSEADDAVADPLSPSFMDLWKTTARSNTDAFRKVFHPIPDDNVKTWKDYDEFYEKYFKPAEATKEGREGAQERPSTWNYGHVVLENFSVGEPGLREVKEILAGVRGTLVEMPLLFLKDEDIAKEGLSFNALTAEVYT